MKELGSSTGRRLSMAASHGCLPMCLECDGECRGSALPTVVWGILSPLGRLFPNFLYSQGSQTLHASELSGGSIKTSTAGPTPGISDLIDPGGGSGVPKICLSNKVPGDADAADLWPTLRKPRLCACQKGRDGTGDARFLQNTVLSPNSNHKESITNSDPLFPTYKSKWRIDKLKHSMLGLLV